MHPKISKKDDPKNHRSSFGAYIFSILVGKLHVTELYPTELSHDLTEYE